MRHLIFANILVMMLVLSCFFETRNVLAKGEQVFKGKGNWLFYNGYGDGYPVNDYKGIVPISSMTMKRIEQNLKRARQAVERRGCDFVSMIIPNKENIYDEYMPKGIKRRTTYSRCDRIFDYLEYNTDLTVVYPKAELMNAKKKYQLYYPTDTHWNRAGQFVGLQELIDVTEGHKLSLEDVEFKKTRPNYIGDLVKLSGGRYRYAVSGYEFVSKVNKIDKAKKPLLIVGDSFGNRLSVIAKKFYGKVRFCHINNFRMGMVRKGETVVWEVVERYIDKYWRINFSGR